MARATKNSEFICQTFPHLLIPEEELKLVILFNFNFKQASYFSNFLLPKILITFFHLSGEVISICNLQTHIGIEHTEQ
jgi:hypothetical protein